MSESSCDKRGHIMSPISPRCGVCGVYSSQMMLVTREVYEQTCERLAAADAREDDLRALCEEINHALWPDPDASHDTSEAPHAIDEMRRSFAAAEAELQKQIQFKLDAYTEITSLRNTVNLLEAARAANGWRDE